MTLKVSLQSSVIHLEVNVTSNYSEQLFCTQCYSVVALLLAPVIIIVLALAEKLMRLSTLISEGTYFPNYPEECTPAYACSYMFFHREQAFP